jgi:hypothetical protein
MKKRILRKALILSAIMGAGFLLFAAPAWAQNAAASLNTVGKATGLGNSDIRVIIGRIIEVALGLVGVVVLVYIIYAGFTWMTAGGDEEKINNAKKILRNAVIGLAIVLLAFSITQFIITSLLGATLGNGGTGNAFVDSFASFDTGSLGEGIIQAHYPPPGATDIPRNTKIIVTFKVKMGRASIIGADGRINPANIRIVKTADLASGGVAQTDASKFLTDVMGYSNDDKTYVFAPTQFLGSPTDKVSYTVYLTGGSAGIQRADGSAAFDGSFSMGYHWEFETSTMIDTTPPQVVSYYPQDGDNNIPRNSLIQINFNEAVDPIGSAGDIPPFSNVKVIGPDGKEVAGSWEIGNAYKTIEFRSNVLGGTNSCGNNVYILPANAKLQIDAAAATTTKNPPQADLPYPFDGVTDVCGNSLDGNENGKAEGPPTDSVLWSFQTSDQIDLTPPLISSTVPKTEGSGADLTADVSLYFSKPMAITTLDNRYLLFAGWAESDPREQRPFWFFGTGDNIGADGKPVAKKEDKIISTRGNIVHEALAPTVGQCHGGVRKGMACSKDEDCGTDKCDLTRFDYYPDATSGITDMNQNCFYPACDRGSDQTPYCCPSTNGENPCAKPCVTNASGGLYCPGAK